MKKFILATVAALAMTGSAQAAFVDFNSTPAGALAEGTVIGGIAFTSDFGTGLNVSNFGAQNVSGNGLAAFSDDANFIKGAIAGGASFISMVFGNDDACCAAVGDLATLRVFTGATLVGTVNVVLNLDDIANQNISYTGAFDNFSFAYTRAGTPIDLIEIIDNIEYTPGIAAAVPEPATWGMMLVGFGIVGGAMRRRQRTSVSFG